MNTLSIITADTPDGAFHLIVDDNDIVYASGFGELQTLSARLPDDLKTDSLAVKNDHPYRKLVLAYYDGDRTALEKIKRTQPGSDFQKQVWQAISDIPYGATLSYKELAIASHKPAAIRAAGTICGHNRLILLVPCHRVLKSDGSIGSYLYGPAIKQSLLEREATLSRHG